MLNRIKLLLKNNPGMTGRKLARALAKDKREVNSFLAKNQAGLMQDAKWRWYLDDQILVENDCVSFKLTSEGWVTADSFEVDFMAVGCLINSDCKSVDFVFPEGCKIFLVAGARLIALANQLIDCGKDIHFDFRLCPRTGSYLDRLGFFTHLHSEVVVSPHRPSGNRAEFYKGNSKNLVEIAQIDPVIEDKTIPERLTETFTYHAGQQYHTAIFTIFSELIRNVSEHSQTLTPGFAALQRYKGTRHHIQIVVSDSGVGIAASLTGALERHYPEIYKEIAGKGKDEGSLILIEKIFSLGEISRFGSDDARGLGLKRSGDLALKYDATITVREQTVELVLSYFNGGLSRANSKQRLPLIKGTHICFDFYID